MELNLKKIRFLRKTNGLSLQQMADLLGYKSPTGYFYAESGRCNFKPNHIPLLADIFGVSLDELYSKNDFTKMVN